MIPCHQEHCLLCKDRIRDLLTSIYGECRTGHSFQWPARPAAYGGTVIGDALERMFVALWRLRGHGDFIKSGSVPPCDFYVPHPPFILEFDESQHFSRPRRLTLSLYPRELKVGFSVRQWLDLCDLIDAEDHDPPDRDERRAWYNALRDLVPTAHGFKPTVRVHDREFSWCSLDTQSSKARETFLSLLQDRLPKT